MTHAARAAAPNPSADPLPSAPLWRRLAAMVYDSFLVMAIWMLVGFVVLWAYGVEDYSAVENGQVVLDGAFRVLMFSAMLLSALLFFGFFWTQSGQTLGMQAWKVKVQNPDGSAISWRQALIRCALAPFSLGLLGLGYLCMYADPQRRSLPDRLSRTQVVLLRSRVSKD